MKIRIVNLGFSVADGGGLQTSFHNGILSGAFTDWQEHRVAFICHDTIAYRWQLAEYTLSQEERFDSVHEITESEWVEAHRTQGYLDSGKEYHKLANALERYPHTFEESLHGEFYTFHSPDGGIVTFQK